jgi:hypothetical protein
VAVEQLVAIGVGKVVWMPTRDAENQVRYDKASRPFVRVVTDGQVVPELLEVFKIMAAKDLVLATGHLSPEEILVVLRAAKTAGVSRFVVSHALGLQINMTVEQMRESAALGAYIEFSYNGGERPQKFPQYARVIRALGPEYCIVSSDAGSSNLPLHTDVFDDFARELMKNGILASEIERMTKTNPARLLGLP